MSIPGSVQVMASIGPCVMGLDTQNGARRPAYFIDGVQVTEVAYLAVVQTLQAKALATLADRVCDTRLAAPADPKPPAVKGSEAAFTFPFDA